jgi:hypothetical protein
MSSPLGAKSPRRLRKQTKLFSARLERLEDRCLLAVSLGGYSQLPLAFEPNVGQAGAGVGFIAQGNSYTLLLNPSEAVLGLQTAPSAGNPAGQRLGVGLKLVGSNPSAAPQASDLLPGISNYFIGDNPADWHTNVPNYGKISYQNVYSGVDLVYYGNQGSLEYDFVVNPGASPGLIRLAVQGAQSLSVDAQGDVLLHTVGGDVLEKAPTVYQMIDGVRQAVPGRFVLENQNQLGFAVGPYNAALALVIDPVLSYATFIGGSSSLTEQAENFVTQLQVDATGDMYISGRTGSTSFPIVGGLSQPDSLAFVAKLNPQGTALLYSTYLGGAMGGEAYADTLISVDPAGDLYAFGLAPTNYTTFPTAGSPYQRLPDRGSPAQGSPFVLKLNPAGNQLLFSTFFGGQASFDSLGGIAIDSAGDVYVAGSVAGSLHGGLNPLPTTPGAFQTQWQSGFEIGFVSELNNTGSALVYSTLLGAWGGSGTYTQIGRNSLQSIDIGWFPTGWNAAGGGGGGLAVDSSGDAIVAGWTSVSSFPTLNAFEPIRPAGDPMFVAKLNPTGTGLIYSTYFGGDLPGGLAPNGISGVATDNAGDAYVTGFTVSTDFSTAGSPFQATPAPNPDPTVVNNSFVSKLDSNGKPIYSTYLHGSSVSGGLGSGEEVFAAGIAVDAAGDAFVVGTTSAPDFPTANSLPARDGAPGAGTYEGFVTEFDPSGSYLLFSTLLGGAKDITGLSSQNGVFALALDANSDLYVAGATTATDFPVTAGAYQTQYTAMYPHVNPTSPGREGFVAKLTGIPTGIGGLTPGYWHAQDLAAAPDNSVRMLWATPKGSGDLWSLSSNGSFTAGPAYGPLTGWIATADAVGSDGNNRVLWTNVNGAAALWIVASDGTVQKSAVFGPVSGWTARDVAVGTDGDTRILWSNSNGAAVVWQLYGSNFSISSSPVYNPGSGWNARKLAIGPDGMVHVLWTNASGGTTIYTLLSSGSLDSSAQFGPIPGWSASGIAVGADGVVRILWNNTNGMVAIWKLSSSYSVTAATVYGPFAGWQAASLAAEPDGSLRLLWLNSGNQATSVWDLTAAGGYQSSTLFGSIATSN